MKPTKSRNSYKRSEGVNERGVNEGILKFSMQRNQEELTILATKKGGKKIQMFHF